MANGGYEPDDFRNRIRDLVYGLLIDKIRRDRFPSAAMMNAVEAGASETQMRDYVGVLVQKVADERFPSTDMLKRVTRLV